MELRFEPPGPGSWELDPVHFPRPVTRYWTELHPEALKRGVQDFTRFYGMLIDTLEYQYVNGFAYKTVRPVPEGDVPQRLKRVEDVFQRKLWREQLHDWDEKIKPTSFKAHRELQSVDPEKLSNEDLITHLTRCRNHHAAMISQHMRFTAAALVPTGDFLAHVGDWTGLPPADLLSLLRGVAPVSAGASAELARLIAAMAQDPEARKLLGSDDKPGDLLQRLRSLEGEAGAAVSAYLDLVGYRLLDGFDISEPYALELPDALLRAIRVAVAAKSRESSDAEERIAGVRMRVPEGRRAEFDELLGGRGRPIGFATSAVYTATSGLPGSCGGLFLPVVADLLPRGGSTTPNTSLMQALRRCALCFPARTAPPPTSWRRVPNTAPRTVPKKRRQC